MAWLWGVMLGAGLSLIWQSWWSPAPRRLRRWTWWERLGDDMVSAGWGPAKPSRVVLVAAGLALLVLLLALALTGAPVVAACFAAIAAWVPFAAVAGRARTRRARLRDVWPDVVDHVASAVRAGMSLPEALIQLGERGPEALRPAFLRFSDDYRATGRFDVSLDLLKDRMADPVADRLVESLRLAREVGGTDLGRLLRALSEFLREDARTRAELEARQSWTVNAARVALVSPWVVLAMLCTRPESLAAYRTPTGSVVLVAGAGVSVLAYRVMRRVGRLPVEGRVLT